MSDFKRQCEMTVDITDAQWAALYEVCQKKIIPSAVPCPCCNNSSLKLSAAPSGQHMDQIKCTHVGVHGANNHASCTFEISCGQVSFNHNLRMRRKNGDTVQPVGVRRDTKLSNT
jgi:hypothetical protein